MIIDLTPLRDHRGQADTFGTPLEVTVAAVADEIAGAADLVKGKTRQVPVAIVRGLAELVTEADGPGAAAPASKRCNCPASAAAHSPIKRSIAARSVEAPRASSSAASAAASHCGERR